MLSNAQLATLNIRQVIFHDVPRHRDEPTLSETPTLVQRDQIAHLKSRLTRVLASKHAYEVTFNISTQSPVPAHARAFTLGGSADFVEMSRDFARHLWTLHTGGVSPGLLCVLDIAVGSQPAVGVMKLEREEGARLELSKHNGKKTFAMSVLNNLVMTDGTRLFKTAIFVRTGKEEDDFIAISCDDQARVTASGDMARFWLQFLGCVVILEPRVATERFYEAAVKYINEQITDPVAKTDLYEHVHSQLKSASRNFVPKTFIEEYVPAALQKPFAAHLKAEHAPVTSFVKDLADIQGRVSRHSFKTKRGAVVTVPSEEVEELVDVTANRIVVNDQLTSINRK
jgi:hypothetical protein